MRLTLQSPKGNRERDFVSPVVICEVREKRPREKETSPAGVNRGACLITEAHPCLPIEPLPFVGNLVRHHLLSLVVDGSDGDSAVPEATLLPAVADQLVILVFGHRVDLVTILNLEAAMLDGIHHKFLQRGAKMELSRFRQTHGR